MTCSLGDIRFVLVTYEDGVPRSVLYYTVDDVGRILSLDRKETELLMNHFGNDYRCQKCKQQMMYWRDVEYHLYEEPDKLAVHDGERLK